MKLLDFLTELDRKDSTQGIWVNPNDWKAIAKA